MRKIARADEGVAQYLGVIYAEPLKSERNNPVERTRRKPLVAGCLTHSSLELQGALVGRSPTTMVGRGMAVSGAKVFHLDVGYKALRYIFTSPAHHGEKSKGCRPIDWRV